MGDVERQIGRLRSRDLSDRIHAAEVLGEIGDARAVELLRARLRRIPGDRNRSVRDACRKAIARIEEATRQGAAHG